MEGAPLGNIAAALVFTQESGAHGGGGARDRLSANAKLLSTLFEDVLIISDPAADAPGHPIAFDAGAASLLDAVVMALESAEAERVMVIPSGILPGGHDLLVGLAAWPEQDVVTLAEASGLPGGCSLYRREAALAIALGIQSGDEGSLEALHAALGADIVSAAALGCDDLLDSVLVDARREAR